MTDGDDDAHYAAQDHFEAEENRGRCHPIVATLVTCVFLLITTSNTNPAVLPSNPAERQGYLVGTILAATFIPWGIAYALTIRKASTGWKIGSLLIIASFAILTALIQTGRDIQQEEEDIAEGGRQIAAALNSENPSPIRLDANAGPMTRLNVALQFRGHNI